MPRYVNGSAELHIMSTPEQIVAPGETFESDVELSGPFTEMQERIAAEPQVNPDAR